VESDSDEDVGEFFDNLARSYLEDVPMNEAPNPEVMEDSERIHELDGPHPGPRDPEDNGGTHLGYISQVPFFCNNTVVKFLGDKHFRVSERDIAGWCDASDFLAKRYGLAEPSGTEDRGKNEVWGKKLGLKITHPGENTVQLYDAVVGRGQWPPLICDLSPEVITVPGVFPCTISCNVLAVSHGLDGYMVAIQDGQTRLWRLLISDPLTVVQIEREVWCLGGGCLVANLLKKGIPFEVLHTKCHEATTFLPSPGPVLHPTGKEPHLADYFAYRHDLVYFLQTYPHAHAAALCAGGILWRTAVDVLPLPSEDAVVGPFHRAASISRKINGDTYWTPRLTAKEEQVVVGVYRWAESKLQYCMGDPR